MVGGLFGRAGEGQQMTDLFHLLGKARQAIRLGGPDASRRALQAVCDELDRMGYRPTGWVDPPVLR